jgi:hypothetical protein
LGSPPPGTAVGAVPAGGWLAGTPPAPAPVAGTTIIQKLISYRWRSASKTCSLFESHLVVETHPTSPYVYRHSLQGPPTQPIE